jgi:hypothetical protein
LQFENKKEQGCVEKQIALKATFASHLKKPINMFLVMLIWQPT